MTWKEAKVLNGVRQQATAGVEGLCLWQWFFMERKLPIHLGLDRSRYWCCLEVRMKEHRWLATLLSIFVIYLIPAAETVGPEAADFAMCC
jgi:hypothetical protein